MNILYIWSYIQYFTLRIISALTMAVRYDHVIYRQIKFGCVTPYVSVLYFVIFCYAVVVMSFTDKSNLAVSPHVSQYYIIIFIFCYILLCSCGHVLYRQIKFGCVTQCIIVLYCYIMHYLHSNIPPLKEKQLTLSSSLSCCFLSSSLLYNKAAHF